MNKFDSHDSVLLSTKLKIPNPRKNYIKRYELFELLENCSEMQVVYILGGAGTGKTTLVSSFIRETGIENVAWISLDETNDNVFSFWHYFTAAIGIFLGNEKDSILSLMRSNFDKSNIENLLTIIINRLIGDKDYYVVLDDVQYIKDSTLISIIDFFLKSIPNNLHIFMLSRENPVFYLGEFAISGRLLFIDSDRLKLSNEEGLRFLKETLKISASDVAINLMNEFAEGWIGGLQLIAAAGGNRNGLSHAVGNGIVADYLTREIYKSLREDEQRFLVLTGALPYFDEEICKILSIADDFQYMV